MAFQKMYTVTDHKNAWGVYLNLGFQEGAFTTCR